MASQSTFSFGGPFQQFSHYDYRFSMSVCKFNHFRAPSHHLAAGAAQFTAPLNGCKPIIGDFHKSLCELDKMRIRNPGQKDHVKCRSFTDSESQNGSANRPSICFGGHSKFSGATRGGNTRGTRTEKVKKTPDVFDFLQ